MSEQPKIYTEMAAIMKEIKGIGKGQRNQQQGFNYRGIDDVYNAIQPIMAEHGVFCALHEVVGKDRQERTTQKGGILAFVTLHLCYRFYASDGSYVETQVVGEGMDSGDKASNKAMAVGHKYAILQAFCIPTEDMPDPDAEAHTLAAKGAQKQPQQQKSAPKKQEATLADRAKKMAADIDKCTDEEELKAFWNSEHSVALLTEIQNANRDWANRMEQKFKERLAALNPFAA